MLWSLWSTCLYGNCRTLLPSSQSAAEHWCCYHWGIISIDHNLEWHRKPGLFFCSLSSLQRVSHMENIPLQVGTRTQGAELVKGGLGEGCELCREASRTLCELLGTKQKRRLHGEARITNLARLTVTSNYSSPSDQHAPLTLGLCICPPWSSVGC